MVLKPLILLLLLAPAPFAAAQDDAEPPPMPEPGSEAAEPAPLPPKAEQPDVPPPAVTIRREKGKVVEEYSMGGSIYMVRVTPENAPPYILVDMDGDGQLERSDSEIGPNILPPHWVLFEWE